MKKSIFLFMLMSIILTSYAYADNFTYFNGSQSDINFTFLDDSDSFDFSIELPNGQITDACLVLNGSDVTEQQASSSDVMLVTDSSGSMQWDNKMRDAIAAGKILVNDVDLGVVKLGLVEYDACPDETFVLPLTDDAQALSDELDTYVANFATNIGGGLALAIDELTGPNARENVPKVIIMMTDGVPNRYYQYDENGNINYGDCLGESAPYTSSSQFVLEQAQIAADNDILIIGIGFGADSSDFDMNLITEMAEITGGPAYPAPNRTELEEIYLYISQTILNSSYTTPTISIGEPPDTTLWSDLGGLEGEVLYCDSDCGQSSATCVDLSATLQSELDACEEYPCNISFHVNSTTKGFLSLLGLNINLLQGEINCVHESGPTPEYFVNEDPLEIPVEDIFTFVYSPGEPSDLFFESGGEHLTLSIQNLPESFSVSSDELENNDGTVTAFTKLITDIGLESDSCPIIFTTVDFASIICKESAPSYLFTSDDEVIEVELNEIFDFQGDEYGTINSLDTKNDDNLIITENFPDSLKVEDDGITEQTIPYVNIRTETGIQSQDCPLIFDIFESNCGSDACQALIEDEDYVGLIDGGCTDEKIEIYNGGSPILPTALYTKLRTEQITISDFYSIPRDPDPNFEITPNEEADRYQTFLIKGDDVPPEDLGVAVLKVQLERNTGDVEITLCPQLNRVGYDIIGELTDPNTELLITGSRSITGFFEEYGVIRSIGPYIFTSKVWLRK